jgi:hypothetical protein
VCPAKRVPIERDPKHGHPADARAFAGSRELGSPEVYESGRGGNPWLGVSPREELE